MDALHIPLSNDIYYNILLHLDLKDLLAFCSVSKNEICDNNFWKQKYVIDYYPVKYNIVSWKTEYIQVYVLEQMRKKYRMDRKESNTSCGLCHSTNLVKVEKVVRNYEAPKIFTTCRNCSYQWC